MSANAILTKREEIQKIVCSQREPDKMGNDCLLNFSENYKKSSKTEKKIIIGAFNSLSQAVGDFSDKELIDLLELIDLCGIGKQVFNSYRDALDGLAFPNMYVAKRAELLRFVAENSRGKISAEYVAAHNQVRTDYPWHWIDAMAEIRPNVAYDEILKHQKDENFRDCLLDRMPTLRREFPKQILENLEKLVN